MNTVADILYKKIPGCSNFKWHEVLNLPQCNIYAFPTDKQYLQLIRITNKLQLIRDEINKPIVITSGLRPEFYNKIIGGAKSSYHIAGMALDFRIVGWTSNGVRSYLKDRLEELDLRMENLPDSTWCHIDNGAVGQSGRFFTP